MQWTVYKIECKPNGKLYIGITRFTLAKRWRAHRSRAGNFHTAIANSINKYGPDQFAISALAVVETLDEAVSLERHHIATLGTMTPRGCNLTTGGEYRKVLSAEARQKISVKAKGRVYSEATRQKMSAAGLGGDPDEPEPGANRGRAYWHGWRVAMMDKQRIEIDAGHRQLTKAWVARERERRLTAAAQRAQS